MFKLKKSVYYFLSFLIIIFVIEIFTRIFLFTITFNSKIFKYGFDKKIELKILDFSKLDFLILNHDLDEFKTSKKFNLNKKIIIWTFGGSTTLPYCKDSTSWPNELAKLDQRFEVKNFAKLGTNSNYALMKFSKELNKNQQKPNIILWSNKVNEQFNYEQNFEVKTIVFVKRIVKTMKSNFVFVYLYDGFIFKFKKHILKKNFKKDFKSTYEKDELYNQAIKNYNINTYNAIFLAKNNNIDFFLVSLFGKFDFQNKNFYKTPFWNIFENNAIFLKKKYKINYINTEKDLKKNFSNLDNSINYFCDNIHHTINGSKLTSKIIYEAISEKFINNFD
tara:strand:+ start:127 stop:1128 length:1002 start_codon:yes stop_codon:yes gene_type:complete